jgi:hypothetical protein
LLPDFLRASVFEKAACLISFARALRGNIRRANRVAEEDAHKIIGLGRKTATNFQKTWTAKNENDIRNSGLEARRSFQFSER